METKNNQSQYWLCNALIGKNRVQGRVLAKNKPEAIERMLKATHTRYPNSLVIVLGDSCRKLY